MPGLSESFFANKSFTLLVAALTFLAAVVLLSAILRFAFGRKLRLPRNGRARQPRLGTIDAFDLDRQRQLVIIRRDNVEHLLMIGGPNDLVIESQIIRAEMREPRDFRDARTRDKELREKEPRDAVSWPAVAESPSPYPPQRKTPFPAAAVLEPETGGRTDPVHNEESRPEFAPSTVLPVQRPPAFPLAPRRASPAAAPTSQRLPNQRESLAGRADSSQRPEPAAGPPKDFRRASVTTPFLRSTTQRQAEATAIRLTPSGAPAALPPAPNVPSPLPDFERIPGTSGVNAATGSGPAPSAPMLVPESPATAAGNSIPDVSTTGLDPAQLSVDELEAEMAKLLGRGPG